MQVKSRGWIQRGKGGGWGTETFENQAESILVFLSPSKIRVRKNIGKNVADCGYAWSVLGMWDQRGCNRNSNFILAVNVTTLHYTNLCNSSTVACSFFDDDDNDDDDDDDDFI